MMNPEQRECRCKTEKRAKEKNKILVFRDDDLLECIFRRFDHTPYLRKEIKIRNTVLNETAARFTFDRKTIVGMTADRTNNHIAVKIRRKARACNEKCDKSSLKKAISAEITLESEKTVP